MLVGGYLSSWIDVYRGDLFIIMCYTGLYVLIGFLYVYFTFFKVWEIWFYFCFILTNMYMHIQQHIWIAYKHVTNVSDGFISLLHVSSFHILCVNFFNNECIIFIDRINNKALFSLKNCAYTVFQIDTKCFNISIGNGQSTYTGN